MDLLGKKVLVAGCGKSGLGAAGLLQKAGAVPVLFDENEKLDDLYAVFNDNPPADYKAHSMSVSDVIITNRGGDMARW